MPRSAVLVTLLSGLTRIPFSDVITDSICVNMFWWTLHSQETRRRLLRQKDELLDHVFGREENEPKVFAHRQVLLWLPPRLSRIEVLLSDRVTARSTEALRFFVESVVATVDVDKLSTRGTGTCS